MRKDLLSFTEKGIYCEKGDFFIDPSRPVQKAVITHAHSDHARWGHTNYLAETSNKNILKLRLGQDINLQLMDYGQATLINGVKVSFHPAGHIWGSSQVRVEYKGDTWVVSGDYKLENDGFSGEYEQLKCHKFITETTFALPVFQWAPQHEVIDQINNWWKQNASDGKSSVLTAYALGKAQRLLTGLDLSIGPVYCHGAIMNVNQALRLDGAVIPEVQYAGAEVPKENFRGSLILTPGSSTGTSWMNKFHPYEVATVSGWMQIRGIKRRRNAGQGFVMSDHVDWGSLNQAVRETRAETIFVTHGYTDVYAKWLTENGYNAEIVSPLSIREQGEE